MIFIAIFLFIVVAIIALTEKEKVQVKESVQKSIEEEIIMSDLESNTKHMVSQNGAYIWAYDSIPVEAIDFVKKYIKNNGYDNNDIAFIFKNSFETYNRDYPSQSGDYYIEKIYKNIIVGYMVIDGENNIIEVNNFIPIGKLLKIQTEPDIDIEAVFRAREYLGLDSGVSAELIQRVIYTISSSDEFIFCYKIQFEGQDDVIYINGITGKRVG